MPDKSGVRQVNYRFRKKIDKSVDMLHFFIMK